MRWKQPVLSALTAVLVIGSVAHAQEDSRPPPCDSAPYHAFDFWVGEWVVMDMTGEVAGTNSVTRAEEGCLLVEHWESARGTTGQSYNYYNPETMMWRQVWVSPSAIIDYEGGPNQLGHMRLQGTITYRRGESHLFRGSWVAEADGSVRQHLEQYNAETEAWEDWFIGLYRRKPG